MAIIIESKNGGVEILKNRRREREENRKIDMALFSQLIKNPINKYHKPKKADKELVGRGNKITAQLVRLYQDLPEYEGAYDEQSVTPEMISHFAKRVVEGDIAFQLQLCREPNRQSLDERVQYEIRKKYLPDWLVENLAPGYLTLQDGEWRINAAKEIASSETTKARSIDFRMTKGDIVVMDFSKFALVAGGGQGHQIKESKYFLTEVRKYIDKHDDNIYFADTLDGNFAESQIPSHKELIKGYERRIFVGNTESVIDWILSL
jgi:hypothetical protein